VVVGHRVMYVAEMNDVPYVTMFITF